MITKLTVEQAGWHRLPVNQELSWMILGNMLTVGTRQYTKGNIRVLFSPEENHGDGLWAHASISHHARYPTWDEILDCRDAFFPENAEVIQILPPKGEYVNLHKNCFHLWSPIGKRIVPMDVIP